MKWMTIPRLCTSTQAKCGVTPDVPSFSTCWRNPCSGITFGGEGCFLPPSNPKCITKAIRDTFPCHKDGEHTCCEYC